MGAPKGTRPPRAGIGKAPGTLNHITRDIREMLRESLDKAGGVAYLVHQAKENPSSYMALIGKIVPQQIDATIRRELPTMTREELLALLDTVPRKPMITVGSAEMISAQHRDNKIKIKSLAEPSVADPHPDPHTCDKTP